MAKWIKNNTVGDKTWAGQLVSSSSYYEIQLKEEPTWASNSTLLSDIANGDAVVAKDDSGNTDITNINQAINYLKNIPNDVDSSGRSIVRYAATIKGWHYQAHSIQFEVNKLNSIYNKDDEGNDLGFTSMKIYDDQGSECTTQGSADTNGVKTVVTWIPGFDFEVISGNVVQLTKQTVDSYLYVNAKIATGLAAPNDWIKIPFSQGGINLSYIGNDEPLKTDGRASKLITGSNGDFFEIIVNYEPELVTNANRHKMSLILEIYKDPAT